MIHLFVCYLSSIGDRAEMVKQAKILAETTSSLVALITMEADDEMDPAARQRLLDAARSLADATTRMVEAAKMTAQNPGVSFIYLYMFSPVTDLFPSVGQNS